MTAARTASPTQSRTLRTAHQRAGAIEPVSARHWLVRCRCPAPEAASSALALPLPAVIPSKVEGPLFGGRSFSSDMKRKSSMGLELEPAGERLQPIPRNENQPLDLVARERHTLRFPRPRLGRSQQMLCYVASTEFRHDIQPFDITHLFSRMIRKILADCELHNRDAPSTAFRHEDGQWFRCVSRKERGDFAAVILLTFRPKIATQGQPVFRLFGPRSRAPGGQGKRGEKGERPERGTAIGRLAVFSPD